MASKGQRFQKVSPEAKREILRKYFDGVASPAMLGEEYGVSKKTIGTWIRKAKMGVDVGTDHREGRSGRKKAKNLTLEDYRERYEILKKYRAFLEARRGRK